MTPEVCEVMRFDSLASRRVSPLRATCGSLSQPFPRLGAGAGPAPGRQNMPLRGLVHAPPRRCNPSARRQIHEVILLTPQGRPECLEEVVELACGEGEGGVGLRCENRFACQTQIERGYHAQRDQSLEHLTPVCSRIFLGSPPHRPIRPHGDGGEAESKRGILQQRAQPLQAQGSRYIRAAESRPTKG